MAGWQQVLGDVTWPLSCRLALAPGAWFPPLRYFGDRPGRRAFSDRSVWSLLPLVLSSESLLSLQVNFCDIVARTEPPRGVQPVLPESLALWASWVARFPRPSSPEAVLDRFTQQGLVESQNRTESQNPRTGGSQQTPWATCRHQLPSCCHLCSLCPSPLLLPPHLLVWHLQPTHRQWPFMAEISFLEARFWEIPWEAWPTASQLTAVSLSAHVHLCIQAWGPCISMLAQRSFLRQCWKTTPDSRMKHPGLLVPSPTSSTLTHTTWRERGRQTTVWPQSSSASKESRVTVGSSQLTP